MRERVIGKTEKEILIGEDMFALEWAKHMDASLPTMIAVAGVYQYFQKDKIIAMIKKMKQLFLKGELIFDVTNMKKLKIANKYVQKKGKKGAEMFFSVDDLKEFKKRTLVLHLLFQEE